MTGLGARMHKVPGRGREAASLGLLCRGAMQMFDLLYDFLMRRPGWLEGAHAQLGSRPVRSGTVR